MDSDREDKQVIADYIASTNADIYVFGFQELVDLENVFLFDSEKRDSKNIFGRL